MHISADKLIRLTGDDHPSEVRAAALTVLGELGGRDAAVNAAVLTALDAEDSAVRVRAVRAAGQLRIDKALPLLIERINHGGVEGELAAEAAAKLGAKGTHALQDVIHKVVPGVRKYIAAALAGAEADGSKDASGIAMLKERDPAVVEAAVGTLAARIPTLDAKRKRALADELFDLAKSKKVKLTPTGEAGIVRLAGLLDDDRVEPLLWDRILPPLSAEVRAAAIQNLARFIDSPGKEQRARLFTCAADPQFRVAAPAMMLLDKVPFSPKQIGDWLDLLDAPDLAPRRFALGKIGHIDAAEVANKLVEQIKHPDRKYRGDVLAKLAGLAKGRKALAKPLREAASPEEAWDLARVVAPFAKGDPKTWGDELFATLSKYLEANDKRIDPLLFVLREAGPAELRDRLEAKAAALKKKEDFERAPALLQGRGPRPGERLLDPAWSSDGRAETVEQGIGSGSTGSRCGVAPILRLGAPGRARDVQGSGSDQVAWRRRVVLSRLPFHRKRRRHGRFRQQGIEALAQAFPQEQAGGLGEE